ncbi:PTS sugar transporter subunit IIB [Pontibacillus yanchengensis]|uniref:PTS galactitol transporter subunit IIB n=1 Tax=Pontibacillus yanchengensis Y32 TaxID=1385514 RepID=A0A0A2TE94_9BACI|nr:PTS sugar transporter subunit IIB [Pontibacillus yanchengensis]KGP72386.1 PTS galactitol transporter subunit IIB [Pontibacillus yanchengensis Y32]
MKKRILVACGTGIATSTVVNDAIESMCKENNINAEVIQCKISDIPSYKDTTDLLVTTTIVKEDYPFPIVNARAFLTGIGLEDTKQEILDELQKNR